MLYSSSEEVSAFFLLWRGQDGRALRWLRSSGNLGYFDGVFIKNFLSMEAPAVVFVQTYYVGP